jgi:hypothetical protein
MLYFVIEESVGGGHRSNNNIDTKAFVRFPFQKRPVGKFADIFSPYGRPSLQYHQLLSLGGNHYVDFKGTQA